MRASVLSLALAGCATPALVPGASPLSRPTLGPGLGAAAEKAGVRVGARAQAWPALETACTPVLVTVVNGTSEPLLVSPGAFVLVAGGGTFHPIRADSIAPGSAETRRNELKSVDLPPRASARGFVYFERVEGFYGPIFLRAELVDARSGALYATVDIPFLLKELTG